MKKITNSIVYIAVIGLAVFSGCKKSSSSYSSSSSNGGSISATINGKSFSGNNCSFSIPGGFLGVTGLQGLGSTGDIYLTINNYTAGTTGSYYISDTSSNITASIDSTAGNYTVTARHGVITITSASSSQMTGTFSFTCTDSTVVSGGSFTAKAL